MTDLQKLRDRMFEAMKNQDLDKDTVIYELSCLVPRPSLERYVNDMESQRESPIEAKPRGSDGQPRCEVPGCEKPKVGRVNFKDYCFEHHPNSIHEPDCPEAGPCTCIGSTVTTRDGSPGFDHAAGYHD